MTCEARAAEPLASSIAEPKRSCACAMTCVKPGMTLGKEIPGQAGDDERNREYNAGIRAYSAESLRQRTDKLKFSSVKLRVAPIAFKYQ